MKSNRKIYFFAFSLFLVFFIISFSLVYSSKFPNFLRYLPISQFVAPSENWKTYELSNITFQVPENYYVTLIDKYQVSISPILEKGGGFVFIDSGFFKFLTDFEQVKNYYQHNEKIKVSSFKEASYGAIFTGQRFETTGFGDSWVDFTEIIIPINNTAILLKYKPHLQDSIDFQTFEKIATSIKAK